MVTEAGVAIFTVFGPCNGGKFKTRPFYVPAGYPAIYRLQSAASAFLRFFEFYIDDITLESPAVEPGYRRTRFVAFHFNKAEALAMT